MIELELHSECSECGFPAINPLAHAGESVPCVNCGSACDVPFPGQSHLTLRCDDCGHPHPLAHLDHDEECESCGGTSLNLFCKEHEDAVGNRACSKCAREGSSEDGPAHKHGDELFLDVLCCVMVADGQASKIEKSRVRAVMKKIQPAWKPAAIDELMVRYIKRIKREGYKPVLEATLAGVESLDTGKLAKLSKCIRVIADADDTIDDRERKVCNMIMTAMPREPELHSECPECGFHAINPLVRAGDSVPCVNCRSPCDVPFPGQSHLTLRCDECGHPHPLNHDEECESCGRDLEGLNRYCKAHGDLVSHQACPQCVQEDSAASGDDGIVYTHVYELILDVLCCVMLADGHASKIEKAKVRAVMRKMQTAWNAAAVDELMVRYIKRVKRVGYKTVLKATLAGVGFLDARKRPLMLKCITWIADADDVIDERERKVCDLIMKAMQPDLRSPWEHFRDRWLRKNKRASD